MKAARPKSKKKHITVNAIQCGFCRDIIFSRANHDMRWCSCGAVAIDGGFDYCRLVGTGFGNIFQIGVTTTKKELYRDWASGADKWGLELGHKIDKARQAGILARKRLFEEDL